jgi:hypothetical protein
MGLEKTSLTLGAGSGSTHCFVLPFAGFAEGQAGNWFYNTITIPASGDGSTIARVQFAIKGVFPFLTIQGRAGSLPGGRAIYLDRSDVAIAASPFADATNVLPFEIVRCGWSVGDTEIYFAAEVRPASYPVFLCYGNADQTVSLANAPDVWNTDYRGVWHGWSNSSPGDESGSSQFLDSSGNGNHLASTSNMSKCLGVNDYSPSQQYSGFKGNTNTNSGLTVANGASLANLPASGLVMSLWVKAVSPGGTARNLIHKLPNWSLGISSSNELTWTLQRTTGQDVYRVSGPSFPLDKWTYIQVVIPGPGITPSIWFDGAPVTVSVTSIGSGSPTNDSPVAVTMCANAVGAGALLMDDVQIAVYNSVTGSAARIAIQYQNQVKNSEYPSIAGVLRRHPTVRSTGGQSMPISRSGGGIGPFLGAGSQELYTLISGPATLYTQDGVNWGQFSPGSSLNITGYTNTAGLLPASGSPGWLVAVTYNQDNGAPVVAVLQSSALTHNWFAVGPYAVKNNTNGTTVADILDTVWTLPNQYGGGVVQWNPLVANELLLNLLGPFGDGATVTIDTNVASYKFTIVSPSIDIQSGVITPVFVGLDGFTKAKDMGGGGSGDKCQFPASVDVKNGLSLRTASGGFDIPTLFIGYLSGKFNVWQSISKISEFTDPVSVYQSQYSVISGSTASKSAAILPTETNYNDMFYVADKVDDSGNLILANTLVYMLRKDDSGGVNTEFLMLDIEGNNVISIPYPISDIKAGQSFEVQAPPLTQYSGGGSSGGGGGSGDGGDGSSGGVTPPSPTAPPSQTTTAAVVTAVDGTKAPIIILGPGSSAPITGSNLSLMSEYAAWSEFSGGKTSVSRHKYSKRRHNYELASSLDSEFGQ